MADFLWKVGAIVLLLGGLIFVHELGHFVVAKLFRVKVLRFSLGFGPKLVGFTRGETEYQVAALPLGGFVRMAGESPEDEVTPEDRHRTFLGQAPWKRSLIALAGPGMNLLFPVLIYFAVFALQREAYSSRIGEVDPDLPAAGAGLLPGDRITAIDGQQVTYFHEIQALIAPRYERPTRVAVDRGGTPLELTVTPLKDESVDILERKVRGKIGVAVDAPAPLIGVSDPATPAAQAGLKTFDRIVQVDGTALRDFAHLRSLLDRQSGPFAVVALREVDLGLPGASASRWEVVRTTVTPRMLPDPVMAPFPGTGGPPRPWTGIEPEDRFVFSVKPGSAADRGGLRRGDRIDEVDGTVVPAWTSFARRLRKLAEAGGRFRLTVVRAGQKHPLEVQLQKETWTNELEQTVTQYTLGASDDPRAISRSPAETLPYSMPLSTAAGRAFLEVGEWVRKMGLVIAALVRGDISIKTVGGPIMLVDIASRAVEAGRDQYLQAMALVSVNLGVMNLLPVPVLDGFHLAAALFEMIRRRPLPARFREIATYVGLTLLATLMIFVFKNDIFRYFINP